MRKERLSFTSIAPIQIHIEYKGIFYKFYSLMCWIIYIYIQILLWVFFHNPDSINVVFNGLKSEYSII